jgi:hypothetical protein
MIVFFSTQVFCDSVSQGEFLQYEKIVKKNSISVIGNASISGVNLARFNPQAHQTLDRFFPWSDFQENFNFTGRIAVDLLRNIFNAYSITTSCLVFTVLSNK